MQTNRVVVFTQTNNSANTLERCISCIINQTYNNIVYYIVDNNSGDATADIIKRFADNDSRIRAHFHKTNSHWTLYQYLPEICSEFNNQDNLIVIDADDEYTPDCIEKLLSFKYNQRLDIVGCASDFIDGISGKDLNGEVLQKNMIVEGGAFDVLFPLYFKFARDSWAKLFPISLLKKVSQKPFDDTIEKGSISPLVFEMLKQAEKFGVLSEKLHKYYIYPDSTARYFTPTRMKMVTPMLYHCYSNYLSEKCGYISKKNREFLYGSYFRAIQNKFLAIVRSPIGVRDKFKLINIIFSDELTFEMLDCEEVDGVTEADKNAYTRSVIDWLQTQRFDVAQKDMSMQLMERLTNYINME